MVKRGGVQRLVRASELVIGDIITVKSGDQIPADMRIISATGFKVCQKLMQLVKR